MANDGSIARAQTGRFSYIRFSTLSNPVQVSFDGTTWLNVKLNDQLGPVSPDPNQVYFRAIGGQAVAVTFDYDNQPFTSNSADTRAMSTRAVGSYFNYAAVVAGGVIVGVNNGNRRKSIIFTTAWPNAEVVIKDMAGVAFTLISYGLPPTPIETDASFKFVYGAGALGQCDLYVGEIYYNQ